MAEMRCGDCRHWGDNRERAAGAQFRRCAVVVFDGLRLATADMGERMLDRADPGDAEEIAEIDAMRANRAVVQDGSGYRAALVSREDFGCVLFEAAADGRSGSGEGR